MLLVYCLLKKHNGGEKVNDLYLPLSDGSRKFGVGGLFFGRAMADVTGVVVGVSGIFAGYVRVAFCDVV